ncbi:PKS-NRPS hybrid synthetase CHGG_01239-like [Tripterygium wilfordii]|uniref:PKS-NRPS hybrid synthetase CHGG_01239-like n=1 Tax=Tripterygium wilfordii TaxID=458696 RepID=UPI0018F80B11|nr:PKS-NRPS hybrid synthetase CHGG_01239-like [Tripterygium wilfordii]
MGKVEDDDMDYEAAMEDDEASFDEEPNFGEDEELISLTLTQPRPKARGDVVESHSPLMVEADTTQFFRTEMEFHNKEDVLSYVRRCGRRHGVVVVVKRSDLNNQKRTPRILFGCERGGGYRAKGVPKKRKSATKKCQCPFSLKAQVTDASTGTWGLVVINGKHNHALVKAFEGHSYVGRLTAEEKDTVERLSRSGVKAREILNHLKLKDPTNATTIKTVYNARTALRLAETAGKSHMQQLFTLLTENGYVTRHRYEPETEVLQDLFWCNSTSIQLARAFPSVFMLDCTYKTNKYRLPLLQIVGVTSTKKTFSVCFCYMSAEKEENYVWALNCFKDLFETVLAGVFICDREIALMNALKTVFPNAKNMLCRVHVSKNVLSNCVGLFKIKAEFDDFMSCWSTVMHSKTLADFDKAVNDMQNKFKAHPKALAYVNDSWLSKYRSYFVAAWVDQFFHLGNTTTNRVESSHSKLKKYLSNSVGGFVQSFSKINLLLQGQVVDIKASFEDSLTRVPIRFRIPFYKELVNVVSTAALEKIETECSSIGSEGVSVDNCLHANSQCFGLPCGHMLTIYRNEGKAIPLSDIHPYWRQLCIQPFSQDPKDEVKIDTEMEMVWRTFALATVPQKLEIKRQLQSLGKASSTSILEPKPKVNVRGRKKGQKGLKASQADEKSTKRDPSAFEHAVVASFYIFKIFDVPGDGHCGFRVVASFYDWGDDGWKIARRDLANELRMNECQYDKVLAPFSSTFELLSSVECFSTMADRKNWMIMPYMGNVVATCYKVVVALISQEQCLTFFPLRDPLPLDYKQGIMVFGYINDSHFIRLELAENSPIPPVSKMWTDHHQSNARGWPKMFSSRIEKFKTLSGCKPSNIATVELID